MTAAIGRVIEVARYDARAEGCGNGMGSLTLVFVDGSELTFLQGGGDCCANVYMTCDDDLPSFTGDRYLGHDVLSGPTVSDDLGVHEVQFLHVRTSGGTITCAGHNEHNGYYGGLDVAVQFNEMIL
jgi:hypothetical protein